MALADLCYEKVRMFSGIDDISASRQTIGNLVVASRCADLRHTITVNAIATETASVALDDDEGLNGFIQRNADDRQEFFNQAMARALKPIDSHANFLMMNTLHPAQDVIQHFRKNNILMGRQFPPMDTYIKVSLGRPEDMQAFWRTWDLLPWAKNLMMYH